MATYVIMRNDELMHYGVKGQQWGVRRYQNPDGTLTEEGKRRYQKSLYKDIKRAVRKVGGESNAAGAEAFKLLNKKSQQDLMDANDELNRKYEESFIKNKGELTEKAFTEFEAYANTYYEKAKKIISNVLGEYGKKKVKIFTGANPSGIKQTVEDLLISASNLESYKREDARKENKKAFDSAVADIRKSGMNSWWSKEMSSGGWGDKFFDHVYDTQGKLLDEWYKKRFEEGSDYDKLQKIYTKRLASNLGLPNTRETQAFIEDWFINGDD